MPSKSLGIIAAIGLVAMAVVGCAPMQNTTNTTTPAPAQQKTAATPPAEPNYSGPVVATYKGGSLTKNELDKQYNLMTFIYGTAQGAPTKKQFITSYVSVFKYLYGIAVKDVKTPPTQGQMNQVYNSYMSQIQTQFQSKQDMENHMKQNGITDADIKLYVEKSGFLQQYFQEQFKGMQVTDAQAQAYYKQNLPTYTNVTVDQILVNSQSLANQIEAQLKAGTKFATLADKYSIDPSAKQNHGHLPSSPASQYVPQFAQAATTLPIGKISDPVHTQYGYHILKVDARTVTPFSQVKDTVKQQLLQQQQQQKESQLISAAQKAANIKVVATDAQL